MADEELSEEEVKRAVELVQRARYRLMSGINPFFGYLAMCLKITPTYNLPPQAAGFGTNGVHMLFNPHTVLNGPWHGKTQDRFLEWCIAHEAEHLALGHFLPTRMGNRDPMIWNIAGDAIIHRALPKIFNDTVPEGLVSMPDVFGGKAPSDYASMIEEEVYEELIKNVTTIKVKWGEKGDMDFEFEHGAGVGEEEQSEREKAWGDTIADRMADPEGFFREIISQADAYAKLYGHDPRKIDGIDIDKILHPPLPWRTLLRRFAGSLRAGSGTDWTHPNKRLPFYWPARRGSNKKVKIRIAIDSSGSISDHDLGLFLVEIDGMMDIIDPDFVVFDTEIELRTKSPKEIQRRMSAGGTRFEPAFEDLLPGTKAVVILTDGIAPAPKRPSLPVFWAICGNGNQAPVEWGWHGHIIDGTTPRNRR